MAVAWVVVMLWLWAIGDVLTGGAATTCRVIVARLESTLPSLTLKVKLSSPVKPGAGI